jgi:hypothetical protein
MRLCKRPDYRVPRYPPAYVRVGGYVFVVVVIDKAVVPHRLISDKRRRDEGYAYKKQELSLIEFHRLYAVNTGPCAQGVTRHNYLASTFVKTIGRGLPDLIGFLPSN